MAYRFSADIIIGEDGDYRISFPDLPRYEQAGASFVELTAAEMAQIRATPSVGRMLLH